MCDDKQKLREITNQAKKNAYEKYLPQYEEFYKCFLYPVMIEEAEQGKSYVSLKMTDETIYYQFDYKWKRGQIPKNNFSKEHLQKFLTVRDYSLEITSVDNKTAYINISW